MRSIQTVAALNCMKTSLIVFNVLLWLTGIVLLIVGIWLHVELHKYTEINGGGDQSSSLTAAAATSTTRATSSIAPYLLIGTGLLILIVGTLGCCCNIREQPMLLYMYAFVISTILLTEAVACGSAYSYRSELSAAFRQGLNESMQVYSVDHWRSSAVNLLQTHVNCCGIDQPKDWYSTPFGKIPGSCCVTNMGCDTKDKRAIHKQGCASVVYHLITSNVQVTGLIAGSIGLFQACGICLSILLGKIVEKTKYEQIAS